MRLFRPRRKPKSDQEEKELVLDTDAEAQAPAQDRADAEVKTEAPADAELSVEEQAPVPEADLLAQIAAATDSEIEAEDGSAQEDDPLDPELLDIFREAKNEVQESTLASELEDIPVQDLLGYLQGVKRGLSAVQRARAQPGERQK
jgi:hypothetical protein